MRILLAADTIGGALVGLRIPGVGHLSESAAYGLAAVIHALLLFNVFGLSAFIFIWLERKVSGRIQDRLGPTGALAALWLAAKPGRRRQADSEGRPCSQRRRRDALSPGSLHGLRGVVLGLYPDSLQRRLGARGGGRGVVSALGVSLAGSLRDHPRRLFERIEMVLVRWHAKRPKW